MCCNPLTDYGCVVIYFLNYDILSPVPDPPAPHHFSFLQIFFPQKMASLPVTVFQILVAILGFISS
jgi:hypothetical protein